jgi:hypothetical protein
MRPVSVDHPNLVYINCTPTKPIKLKGGGIKFMGEVCIWLTLIRLSLLINKKGVRMGVPCNLGPDDSPHIK